MAEPTTTPAPSVGRAAFTFILFMMVALDFLAFGIIVPVLPDLIRSFEGGDFGRASAITGYFGFAWNAMLFNFSPLLGAWSDRFERRPVILNILLWPEHRLRLLRSPPAVGYSLPSFLSLPSGASPHLLGNR
jgi:MFS family permease